MSTTLDRTTFETSREMDFFSEKELIGQTGHEVREFPHVVVKELIDNALDAIEDMKDGPAPEITVTADCTGIGVLDNGPGLPESTLIGAMNFGVRCSNREMYVAPDRGAQGNALKTLLSMPSVVDPDGGKLIVDTGGVRHEIVCRGDPISQRAVVDDRKSDGQVETGTLVRVQWTEKYDSYNDLIWPFDQMEPLAADVHLLSHLRRVVRGFAFFNPHLSIRFEWFGKTILNVTATDPGWRKWKPNRPTSPHWYELRHMERLIGAYVSHARDNGGDRTVAEFLREFDGLRGSAKRKAVMEEVGLLRASLSTLVVDGDLDHETIKNLLAVMKRHTKEVNATQLGVIGKTHFATRLQEMGGDPEQFEYSKIARVDDGIPFVLETAFSWLGDDAPDERQIFVGANWSAAIKNPFRSFGRSSEGLDGLLSSQYAGEDEPVVFLMHIAHPRIEYTDRGKSAIVISERRPQR
jgi:DNA topoisomerase VI subunit B